MAFDHHSKEQATSKHTSKPIHNHRVPSSSQSLAVLQIGLWGIIAISIAMVMIGSLGTILIQRVYDRHKKGRLERNEWMDKGGEQI